MNLCRLLLDHHRSASNHNRTSTHDPAAHRMDYHSFVGCLADLLESHWSTTCCLDADCRRTSTQPLTTPELAPDDSWTTARPLIITRLSPDHYRTIARPLATPDRISMSGFMSGFFPTVTGPPQDYLISAEYHRISYD